ncbi:uncharacterized protein LOC112566963 [Pomacea canaliculata]|uniref:uncharacterized protein LOC112566963 n=1 Tax=Pomacea canaliculata TaxID=400727 RepID=UPI000D737553|nr:uncharacterized protein LOC112566963 [Pomacea canaliculata]
MTDILTLITSALAVLLALRPGVTRGQSSIGFRVDPSEGSLRVVTPNTNLSITCFWDTEEFVNVSGVVDTNTILVPLSVSQANRSTRGSVVFIIQGISLPLGEHLVNLTARCLTPLTTASAAETTTISSTDDYVTETVMFPIEESIYLTVYNEEPITGLRLDHSNSFYDVVNDTTKLTASVATGRALTVQWVFDDQVYVQQVPDNVSSLDFTYPNVWKNTGTFTVYLNVSNRVSTSNAQANVTVFHRINGFNLFTSDTILQTLEELVLTLTMASDTKEPMGNVTFNVTWGDGATEFDILNINAGHSLIVRHTYEVQGDKTGSLELVSPLDNKAFIFAVKVWNKLNVTLNISPAAAKPRDNFTLTFVNPPNVGFQYIINCSGRHLFSNNQSALYANFSPPVPPYTVSFENVGEYVISFYAFNPLYSVNTSYTVYVEIPLTGLQLTHGNRFYDKVNDTTKLTATFATGTALTAQWIFDDKVYVQQVSFLDTAF